MLGRVRLKADKPHQRTAALFAAQHRHAAVQKRLRFLVQHRTGIRQAGGLGDGVAVAGQRRKRRKLGGAVLHGHGPVPGRDMARQVDDIVIAAGVLIVCAVHGCACLSLQMRPGGDRNPSKMPGL